MIVVRIWEGLGNQMFQYAFARSLMKRKSGVFIDLDKAYDNSFDKLLTAQQRKTSIHNYNISVPSIDVEELGVYFYLRRKNGLEYLIMELARKKMWPFTFIEETDSCAVPEISIWNRHCYIKGWFQNINVLSDIRGELLKEYTPKEKIKISKSLKAKIFERDSVAVHVRRGDYVSNNIALPLKYYYLAQKEIEKKVEEPIYVVFSDDYRWVKNHLDLGENTIYVDEWAEWKDYEQLYVMSKCKHQIMANSTFSWWAAWLNQNMEKIIVMPKQYILAMPELKMEQAIIV